MAAMSSDAPFEIFECLKAATAHAHAQIEQRVPVFDPQFDLAGYIRLLERFYGFWVPVEAKLSGLQTLLHPALALQTRLKGHLLEADLRKLGHPSGTVPQCLDLPSIDTFAAGLGCLYVLEGSTLGARFISQRLEAHLGLRADSGAAFFNAYGEAVGQRWKEFRSFVTGHVSLEQSEETVNAARQTFERLYTWLDVPLLTPGR